MVKYRRHPTNIAGFRVTGVEWVQIPDSDSNQRNGAVACQIHARGVHTFLLMDVAVSEVRG